LKLEALRNRQDAIRARIAKLEARQKATARKAETRLETIVGAAVLADIKLNPETRERIVAILEKRVTARRDRNFLKVNNWL
jgi:hypothetical protein